MSIMQNNFLRTTKNILFHLLLLCISGSSQEHAQSKHAHEHGKGKLEITIDKNGDIDRDSFLAFVENGKQVVKETLPKMSK